VLSRNTVRVAEVARGCLAYLWRSKVMHEKDHLNLSQFSKIYLSA